MASSIRAFLRPRRGVWLAVVLLNGAGFLLALLVDSPFFIVIPHLCLLASALVGVLMTEFRPVSDGQARIQVLADRIVRTGQLSVGLAGIAIIEIVGIVLFDKSVAMLVLDSMIFPGTSFVAIVALLGYPFLLLFVLSWRRKEELDVIIYRAVKESAIASGVRPPFLVGGDQEAVEQFREFLVSSFPSVIRRLPGKDEWEVSGLSVEALLASIQMRARNDQEMVFLFASDPRDSGRSEQGR